MSKAKTPIPSGYHSVTVHLHIKGAAEYIDFLKRAFSAVEVFRAPGPGGKLMHVEMTIGDSRIMFADDFSKEFGLPPLADKGRMPYILHLYVPDADATFAQAVAGGCTVAMPLADMFWGDRYGHVQDPFGVTWAIATHKEDLTMEEMQERQAKEFGGASAHP